MTVTEERSWTGYGYQTPEEHQRSLEWERTSRDKCVCLHLRLDHGDTGCHHVYMAPAPSKLHVPCTCEAFTPAVTAETVGEPQ